MNLNFIIFELEFLYICLYILFYFLKKQECERNEKEEEDAGRGGARGDDELEGLLEVLALLRPLLGRVVRVEVDLALDEVAPLCVPVLPVAAHEDLEGDPREAGLGDLLGRLARKGGPADRLLQHDGHPDKADLFPHGQVVEDGDHAVRGFVVVRHQALVNTARRL